MPNQAMLTRRAALSAILSLFAPARAGSVSLPASLPTEPWAAKLITAAEAQVGVTLSYDPAYRKLSFPGGDVPRAAGVCTDVVIRAYRDALGADLQQLVNADMKRIFAAYPKIWGLSRTDTNIDHRRVPNLKVFFKRKGAEKPVSAAGADYLPGDLVTQMLPGNLPHIAIISNQLNADQSHPLVIHNIGGGAQIEDTLFAYEITGRYRYPA